MVYMKRVGVGTLIASACLFVTANVRAGLLTYDAANVAGTVSIVKNGAENLKGIGDITNKVGELNTIVGDAAASVSKFQSEYGDKIQKGVEIAQKVAARKAEAEAAKAEHDAEIQAQKDAYQAAMDSVSSTQTTSSADTAATDVTTQTAAETVDRSSTLSAQTSTASLNKNVSANKAADLSAMSSANRVYEDDNEETESLDGIGIPEESLTVSGTVDESSMVVDAAEEAEIIDGADVSEESLTAVDAEGTESTGRVATRRRTFARPAKLSVSGRVVVDGAKTDETAVEEKQSSKLLKAIPESKTITVAPAQTEAASSTVENKEQNSASPVRIQRKQFRVSPQLNVIEKVSSSTIRHSEKLAFASAEEGDSGVGNSYINEAYIVPMAQRCDITPESFINDTNVRNECLETIIRENNADNSFDSALSMKDCRKMVYEAVIALLAEATNAKYEAANYSDTLDEQDKLAADSTDVRGDLTVIAMSNYQTQLLLNRISMNYASQLILETTEQLCAARKDVLGDSDLDEDTEDGE